MAELWMALLYADSIGPVRETFFSLCDEAFRRSFQFAADNLPVLDRLGQQAGLGVPGLTVPAGKVDGLPVGVQIISRWFEDECCLTAAG